MRSAATVEDCVPGRSETGWLPVVATTLTHLDDITFNLYRRSGTATTMKLFCRQGLAEFKEMFARLGDRRPEILYVSKADGPKYRATLRDNLTALLLNDAITPAERFGILKTAVVELIEHSYRLVNVAGAVYQSRQVGCHVARMLRSTNLSPRDVLQFAEHDYTTFTHLINVASYCVLLAQKLGIQGERELEEIAIGGMLHDIGKRMLPRRVLTKPGALTPSERERFRQHPQKGYEELYRRKDLSLSQLMMVYQHHERWDGEGYPVQLVGAEIHPMARLIAVVDVFDALTSTRSYRTGLSTSEVLDHLQARAGTHFDEEMVRCWIAAFSA